MLKRILWAFGPLTLIALLGVTSSGFPYNPQFGNVILRPVGGNGGIAIGSLSTPLAATLAAQGSFFSVVNCTACPGKASQGFIAVNKDTSTTAENFALEGGNDTVGHELVAVNTSTTFTGTLFTGGPTGEQAGLSAFKNLCVSVTTGGAAMCFGPSGLVSINAFAGSHLTTIGFDTTSTLRFNLAQATTVGATGAASALPANPLGYMSVTINGTNVKIPFYNP